MESFYNTIEGGSSTWASFIVSAIEKMANYAGKVCQCVPTDQKIAALTEPRAKFSLSIHLISICATLLSNRAAIPHSISTHMSMESMFCTGVLTYTWWH